LERRAQCGLIDDGTAAGIDQHGVGLHQAQLTGADQAARRRRQRHVQTDHVARAEQQVQVDITYAERLLI